MRLLYRKLDLVERRILATILQANATNTKIAEATRQFPPAQIKVFAASRGASAKTDRIDAELIARFMVFRPEARRNLPHEEIRLLKASVPNRGQFVETSKMTSGTDQGPWETGVG